MPALPTGQGHAANRNASHQRASTRWALPRLPCFASPRLNRRGLASHELAWQRPDWPSHACLDLTRRARTRYADRAQTGLACLNKQNSAPRRSYKPSPAEPASTSRALSAFTEPASPSRACLDQTRAALRQQAVPRHALLCLPQRAEHGLTGHPAPSLAVPALTRPATTYRAVPCQAVTSHASPALRRPDKPRQDLHRPASSRLNRPASPCYDEPG